MLIVVGILTFSDQKLIDKLKTACKEKNVFIIHNLYNLIKIKQIKDYIENTLLKTFKLKQNTMI